MSEIKTKDLEKIVSFLSKTNRKYLSLDDLSSLVGLYPDALGKELTFFEPMVMMDPSLNMRNLLEPIKAYLMEQGKKKEKTPKSRRVVASSKELSEYSTIAEFVYAKMAYAGGLMDPSAKLNDHDLHVLQKLVNREVKSRKALSRKKTK
jgi:hypothetical protein